MIIIISYLYIKNLVATTDFFHLVINVIFRGLLLPKVVVDDHGGTRSDAGKLGSGIYFASDARLVNLFIVTVCRLQTPTNFICVCVCLSVCLSHFYSLNLAYYGLDFDQTLLKCWNLGPIDCIKISLCYAAQALRYTQSA